MFPPRRTAFCFIIYNLLFIIYSFAPLHAAKAHRGFYVHTQPDGTQIEVQLVGDEHNHFFLTREGTLMLKDGQQLYVPDAQTQRRLISRSEANASNPRDALRYTFPHSGSPRVVVILAEFQDTVFSLSNPRVIFDRYLNSEDLRNDTTFVDDCLVKRNMGSVYEYFRDVSFGAFTPRFDVYGPVKLSQPLAYYGKDDETALLVRDACAAVNDSVDFSQYDSDGDGVVDLVYVIGAGYSESFAANSSDCLWPKLAWGINGGSYDGVSVKLGGMSCELHDTPTSFSSPPYKRCSAIGLFCHEFSHALGLPDLYATNSNAQMNNQSMEYWDLMDGGEYKDNNGYTPPAYTAYERQCFGWCTIDTLSEDGDYTLLPLDRGGKAYYLPADSVDVPEGYYLENVQSDRWGEWGSSSRYEGKGHGLVIIHTYNIDKEFARGTYPNNTLGSRYTEVGQTLSGATTTYTRYKLFSHYHALSTDTMLISEYWLLRDYFGRYYTYDDYAESMMRVPFPGPDSVHVFNATSRSKPWIYQGDGLMHKSLLDIQESADGVISFRFEHDAPTSLLPSPITHHPSPFILHPSPYDLHGRRVGKDYKGMVFIGGKKVLRR